MCRKVCMQEKVLRYLYKLEETNKFFLTVHITLKDERRKPLTCPSSTVAWQKQIRLNYKKKLFLRK